MSTLKPIIQYENTVQGIFVERTSQFTAEVLIDGQTEYAHIRNTGRLTDLLVPKAKITLQRAENPERKTNFDLISVYRPKLKWVNIDSLAPNELIRQDLENMNYYDVIIPEYTYGSSRFDFYMEKDGKKYLQEVKGCTLADSTKRGVGLFPDAPSERAVKHLDELTAAAKEGYFCSIVLVIQMNSIHLVFPNTDVQPEFEKDLIRAAKAGVQISYYSCHVEADSIKTTGITGDTSRYKNA